MKKGSLYWFLYLVISLLGIFIGTVHSTPDNNDESFHLEGGIVMPEPKKRLVVTPELDKKLIVITPTYGHAYRVQHLTRMMYALRTLPYDVVWIVVEAGGPTDEVAALLEKSKPFLKIRHLGFYIMKPFLWEEMRLQALRVVSEEGLDGTIMFAHECNMHNFTLFNEIQEVEWIGAYSVGIPSHLNNTMDVKVDNEKNLPSPTQGAPCKSTHELIGWYPFNAVVRRGLTVAAYTGDTGIVLSRSGPLMNSWLLWREKEDFRPEWTIDSDMVMVAEGGDESPIHLVKQASMVESLGGCGVKLVQWYRHAAKARVDSNFSTDA